MWKTDAVQPFNRKSLELLKQNRIPAIRIVEFATLSELQSLKAALIENNRRSSSVPQVTRFGISQYEEGIKLSKEEYFDLSADATVEQQRIFTASFDPVQRFLSLLRTLVDDADIMQEPGFGPYYAGNGKMRNGFSPIHVDFAPQDSSGWAIGESQSQLAWNLYIDVPEQGGELLIWEKEWQPADDQFQAKGSYYFDEAVISGYRCLAIKPKPCEVLLLNSRSFHAVAQSDHRFAFGSFIACFVDDSMRLWS